MKEPDAGKPPVRFDEGGGEILPYSTPTLLRLRVFLHGRLALGEGLSRSQSLGSSTNLRDVKSLKGVSQRAYVQATKMCRPQRCYESN